MGEYQINKSTKAKEAIIAVLSDGKWHQYNEIKEKSNLQNPTVSKYLKAFKKLLEKKEDEKDSRYVLYRLKPALMAVAKFMFDIQNEWQEMKKTLFTTKNPLLIMDRISNSNNVLMIGVLEILKNKKQFGAEKLDLGDFAPALDIMYDRYRFLTTYLLRDAEKMLADIDLVQYLTEIENRLETDD